MQSAAVVSQAQTVGKLLDQVISLETARTSNNTKSAGLVWLESAADVERINRDLSDALELQVMDLSALGYTSTALTLRDAPPGVDRRSYGQGSLPAGGCTGIRPGDRTCTGNPVP